MPLNSARDMLEYLEAEWLNQDMSVGADRTPTDTEALVIALMAVAYGLGGIEAALDRLRMKV